MPLIWNGERSSEACVPRSVWRNNNRARLKNIYIYNLRCSTDSTGDGVKDVSAAIDRRPFPCSSNCGVIRVLIVSLGLLSAGCPSFEVTCLFLSTLCAVSQLLRSLCRLSSSNSGARFHHYLCPQGITPLAITQDTDDILWQCVKSNDILLKHIMVIQQRMYRQSKITVLSGRFVVVEIPTTRWKEGR